MVVRDLRRDTNQLHSPLGVVGVEGTSMDGNTMEMETGDDSDL